MSGLDTPHSQIVAGLRMHGKPADWYSNQCMVGVRIASNALMLVEIEHEIVAGGYVWSPPGEESDEYLVTEADLLTSFEKPSEGVKAHFWLTIQESVFDPTMLCSLAVAALRNSGATIADVGSTSFEQLVLHPAHAAMPQYEYKPVWRGEKAVDLLHALAERDHEAILKRLLSGLNDIDRSEVSEDLCEAMATINWAANYRECRGFPSPSPS